MNLYKIIVKCPSFDDGRLKYLVGARRPSEAQEYLIKYLADRDDDAGKAGTILSRHSDSSDVEIIQMKECWLLVSSTGVMEL